MKKHIRVVINPISGVGKQKIIEPLLEKHLDKDKFQYKIIYTEGPKHIIELAKNAVNEQVDAFVVVGGDGSVNEAAQSLIKSNTMLGIIPSGSGNGLARHLNIPLDFTAAIKTINHFKTLPIDTLQLNKDTVVNMAGIGFDAQVAHEFAKYGKRGFSSYIKVVLRELVKYKKQGVILKTDERTIEKEVFLVSFANGSQYGNNAIIAPNAKINDGIMDIVIIHKLSVIGIIQIAVQMFRGTLQNSSYFEIIKTRKAEIIQHSPIAHIDGEPIMSGNKINIAIQPSSLQIIVP